MVIRVLSSSPITNSKDQAYNMAFGNFLKSPFLLGMLVLVAIVSVVFVVLYFSGLLGRVQRCFKDIWHILSFRLRKFPRLCRGYSFPSGCGKLPEHCRSLRCKALCKIGTEDSLESVQVVPSMPLAASFKKVRLQHQTPYTSLNSSVEVTRQMQDAKTLGSVSLRLVYKPSQSQLFITVENGRDLPAKDMFVKSSDPYCKLMLFPEHRKVAATTKIISKTLNPVWNQMFRFSLQKDQIKKQVLFLYVFDHNRFSEDDLIGEVRIRLDLVNITTAYLTRWDIGHSQGVNRYIGKMLVSMSYNPCIDGLTVNVLKMKDLHIDGPRSCNLYVNILMMQGNTKQYVHKTKAVKEKSTPVFNEEVMFSAISWDMLEKINIVLKVKDHGTLGNTKTIGYACVGNQSQWPSGRIQWQNIMNPHLHSSTEWHYVQSNKPLF